MKTVHVLGIALFMLASAIFLEGCGNSPKAQILETGGKSQVELRAMQSRVFKTSEKAGTLRTVIATLQDLNFVMDKAHLELGTVSGTKLDGYQLRMTVSVRPRDAEHVIISANAQVGVDPVVDPAPYQQFFEALSKALFLDAHPIE